MDQGQKKVATLIAFAKISELKTRKNLMRDLPNLERTLVSLTTDLYGYIKQLSGLDPRRFGAKKKYETLCADTAVACKFFHAYLRSVPYQGYRIAEKDVIEAVNAWVGELNKWAAEEQKTFWSSMRGKVICLREKISATGLRFRAVDEFVIEVEEATKNV